MSKKVSGLAMATAVAAVFSVGVANISTAHAEDMSTKCYGINACKGKSACKTASNACKGQNACKGKGWVVAASETECGNKGGMIVPPSK